MARKSKRASAKSDPFAARWLEVALITIGAFSVLLLLSLVSYSADDPGLVHAGDGGAVHNLAGRFGAGLADMALTAFGFFAYLLPPLLLVMAWNLARYNSEEKTKKSKGNPTVVQLAGLMAIVLSSTVLAHFTMQSLTEGLAFMPGGIVGSFLALALLQCFNFVGSVCVATLLLFCGITLLTGLSWVKLVDTVGHVVMRFFTSVACFISNRVSDSVSLVRHVDLGRTKAAVSRVRQKHNEPELDLQAIASRSERMPPQRSLTQRMRKKTNRLYSLPKVQLLDAPVISKTKKLSAQQIEQMSREVESHLGDFKISADVVGVHPGPVITRFELQLSPGTKVSKISALAKDLARSLSVTSVRVVEIITGKSVIGLEVPNESREKVGLRSVITSTAFRSYPGPLCLALGKDISGEAVVLDLAKMPHCLVAGTTGSGKSVGLNTMIISLLFRLSPSQLRLILVDPKMLELSIYDGIPHLLTPVITDMKDVARALRWCIYEMERRYRLMSAMRVRNITSFNDMVISARESGSPLTDPLWQEGEGKVDPSQEAPLLETLPHIVVVVDEFADMIMVVGKQVEELITRLAQKARAAGVHLILATQRPSVNVITGSIKANIPARIAYQVSSKIDSRTVLDQQGAEQLLGHGDMLYLAPGTGDPKRVHGAFIGDAELKRVTDAIKAQGEPDYLSAVTDGSVDEAMKSSEQTGEGFDNAEKDALYDQAVQIVLDSKRASISNIQRRLKIGYNRAARIVDAMEAAGLVSPMDKNGSRTVNIPEFEE